MYGLTFTYFKIDFSGRRGKIINLILQMIKFRKKIVGVYENEIYFCMVLRIKNVINSESQNLSQQKSIVCTKYSAT